MRVLVTGGAGHVGRFVVEHLLAEGHAVVAAGRALPEPGFSRPVEFHRLTLDPYHLAPAALAGTTHLVHAAFAHVPGRYRGGEGDDPAGFSRANRDGSRALFEAAKAAGIRSAVFLSSRAVYGSEPAGTSLHEKTVAHPDTLYGTVKHEAEADLAALAGPDFVTTRLRVTGVYGATPGTGRHKWEALFADWLAGRAIAPRCGTEVHGEDVAQAVRLALFRTSAPSDLLLNVSDVVADRRDILRMLAEESACENALPERGDPSALGIMRSDRLRALGWRPGGKRRLEDTVRQLARAFIAGHGKG
ncbi:NAD-dependent epimerase/dehydratase family protein [Pararhizobium mangrovi]|uniref:NAD(P)-dependent oxidoreductase n=1 Tax=Pararhizobium mangrovi TaxID=2590452 RepID=A0A506UHA3_9HYPH|nr:NAD(P)-dependent oxidoreductase [Pararhizobium mangrovi]TPW32695.1 NAD(P)-dependent oxidoreductase [Pararhizobium mangrovi]